MTIDGQAAAPGREADFDLYTIGADIPEEAAVVLVTEIDNSDERFVGQWTTEEEMSNVRDGCLYIRLRNADPASPALVDAQLVLAHDGQLLPIVRLHGVSDWAIQLRTPAAAIMTLHTDLESGEVVCKARADDAASH